MNKTQLSQHPVWLAISVVVMAAGLNLALLNGTLKPAADIVLLDIAGEGSIFMFTLGWIVAVLASRPRGRVTSLMSAGLNCFMFTMLLDVLDEFFDYPPHSWVSVIESVPAALGMVVMSIALYLWHKEQLALNQQLYRREWHMRSHEQIDPVTQLYRGAYWRGRVSACHSAGQAAGIILLDLNNFSHFNQRYGFTEGNRFLKEIGQLILMHLRPVDLACRYAGDRFALLLPDTDSQALTTIAGQLEASVNQIAFRTGLNTTAIFHSARTVTSVIYPTDAPDIALHALLLQLDNADEAKVV